MVKRTSEQINRLLAEAERQGNESGDLRDARYADGVRDGVRWVLGVAENPFGEFDPEPKA